MKSAAEWKIKNAAFDFKSKRGNFYLDLASVMEAMPGESVTRLLAKGGFKNQVQHWVN